MHKPVYVFGPFRLDTLARELQRDGEPIALPVSAFDCLVYLIEHRQRPVSKDELIAAAWGSKEASDNLLAQNIVRLRRLTDGDTPCIRTVPRYGYRWVADTRVETHLSEPAFAEPGQYLSEHDEATSRPAPPAVGARRRIYRWAAAMAVVCATVLAGLWLWGTRERAPPVHPLAPEALVVVLPAQVKAEGEWTWLRFGVMDIVASHLRAAGLRTVPSETVMALSHDGVFDAGDDKHTFDATWQITPDVKYLDGTWRVHLGLRSVNGRLDGVETSSKDVLVATRQAADALLSQMGVPGTAGGPAPSLLDDWLSKVAAARMQNEIDAAQAALDEVPAIWRNTPEVAYVQAILECDRGQRELCTQHLQGLLERLDKEGSKDSVLRGRVLYTLGMRYAAAQQMDKAAATLDESIRLLEAAKAGNELANAYLNRAWVAQTQDQLDLASTLLGKGRATYTLTGNVFDMSRADFDMGLIAAKQGQLDSAMAFLQRAYDQYVRYGARTMLPTTLDGMAGVAKQQLKYRDELAITDRFWPLSDDLADIHMRRELIYVRAIALADNGRIVEASSIAHQLLRDLDLQEDAALVAEVPQLLAQMAYDTGDNAEATRFARQAMAIDDGLDRPDRASTWLLLVRALARSGHAQDAASEAERFTRWASGQTAGDGSWSLLYADLAQAELLMTSDAPHGLRKLETLMAMARREGVPSLIVNVGCAYASALLKTGQVDQALAVSGTLSAWVQDDVRVVTLQARIYEALGHTDARDKATQRARLLAGERPLPKD